MCVHVCSLPQMWLTATNVLLAMEPTQRAVLLQSTAAQCCYRVQRASQEWKRRRCYRVAAGSGSAATEHTTGSGSAATEHAGQERCELFLYLDYHGVLDTGVPDMLEAMRRFLIRVDHIKRLNLHHMTDMHPDIYVTLLSKRSWQQNRIRTLDEIAGAGVLHLLDRIVFTSERTSHDHAGWAATEHHSYSGHEQQAEYEFYHGGKDDFIHSQHGKCSEHRIMFVDDKSATVEAVCAASGWRRHTPPTCGLEMRRHRFYTEPSEYGHVRDLDELYDAILFWAADNAFE